jgi:hypothetical protein
VKSSAQAADRRIFLAALKRKQANRSRAADIEACSRKFAEALTNKLIRRATLD